MFAWVKRWRPLPLVPPACLKKNKNKLGTASRVIEATRLESEPASAFRLEVQAKHARGNW